MHRCLPRLPRRLSVCPSDGDAHVILHRAVFQFIRIVVGLAMSCALLLVVMFMANVQHVSHCDRCLVSIFDTNWHG